MTESNGSNKQEDQEQNPNKNDQDEILALMFCEFDNQGGPKILYQRPNELISKAIFDTISSYIIPKIQLKNRIITVTVGQYRIVGYPIFIEHMKYRRNQYIFNICFIFNQNTNTCSYEAIVKKLASDLRTLEVECAFLSTEKLRAHLPKLLEQIRSNLNSSGECIIQKIGNLEHSAIFLKLIKNHVDPQDVQSFEVPVFIVSPDQFEIDDWDLTTKKIVSCINGFKTVLIISNETNIETSVVKEAIQNLLYAGVVLLVPIINFSSMFVLTSSINQFYSSTELHQESIRFVQLDKDKEPPTFYDVFFTYNQFKYGTSVQHIHDIYHPQEKNIDIKKLILFGLMKGFLRKLHRYPIALEKSQVKNGEEVNKWLTGIYNYDKICSSLGLSVRSIEEQLQEQVVICIK